MALKEECTFCKKKWPEDCIAQIFYIDSDKRLVTCKSCMIYILTYDCPYEHSADNKTNLAEQVRTEFYMKLFELMEKLRRL